MEWHLRQALPILPSEGTEDAKTLQKRLYCEGGSEAACPQETQQCSSTRMDFFSLLHNSCQVSWSRAAGRSAPEVSLAWLRPSLLPTPKCGPRPHSRSWLSTSPQHGARTAVFFLKPSPQSRTGHLPPFPRARTSRKTMPACRKGREMWPSGWPCAQGKLRELFYQKK